jgi:hypothetical protein
MKGLLFAQITPDPRTPGAVNVKLGRVAEALGPANFLLEFNGPKFNFLSVLPAAQLESFMFFVTSEERQTALQSLVQPTQEAAPPSGDATP